LKISLVMIARNEGAELKATAGNLSATLPSGSELVVVNDGTRGKPPRLPGWRVLQGGGLGVARSRNLGASRTRGDLLIFADAHIRMEEGWWLPLARVLEKPGAGAAAPAVTHLPPVQAIGYGLTFKAPDLSVSWLAQKSGQPHQVPIVPGCCLAIRREVFRATGGWDDGLMQRGGVDNELSVRLWTLGYDLYVEPRVLCRHLFRAKSPYRVDWPEYLQNRLRLAMAHFSGARLARVLAALQSHEHFGAAMALALENGITGRRREMQSRRVRTDDQYFRRFQITW